MNIDKVNIESLLEFIRGRRLRVDSRTIESGDIFIAIKGEKLDGNDYVKDAFQRGAFGAIAERGDGDNLVLVNDVAGLLAKASSFLLSDTRCKRVVIAGSNGKTTTKEITYHFLSQLGATFKTPGNLNTEIGIPIAILENAEKLRNSKYAIFEIGTSNRGDISFLTGMIKPDLAVLLNFGTAHRGCFYDVNEHLKEKLDVFSYSSKETIAITSSDDQRLREHVMELSSKKLLFGFADGDFQILNYTYFDGDTGLAFKACSGTHFIRLNGLWNKGQLLDFGAAYLIAEACGMEEPLLYAEDLRLSFKDRFAFREVRGIRIFIDSYNSSLESAGVAVEALEKIKKRKIFAVLGSILEQGIHSGETHKALGRLVNRFDHVLIYNKDKEIDAILETCKPSLVSPDPTRIIDWLKENVSKNDVVYFKASRGIKMEEIIDEFLERIKDEK